MNVSCVDCRIPKLGNVTRATYCVNLLLAGTSENILGLMTGKVCMADASIE